MKSWLKISLLMSIFLVSSSGVACGGHEDFMDPQVSDERDAPMDGGLVAGDVASDAEIDADKRPDGSDDVGIEYVDYDRQYAQIEDRYQSILDGYQECFEESGYRASVEGCMTPLEYEPGLYEQANEASNGKRVMIIDNGMEVTSMLRLASRLVALYRIDENGNLNLPYAPGDSTEYIIPTPLRAFLSDALVRESPIPPAALTPLVSSQDYKMIAKVVQDYQLSDPSFNHGIGLVVKLRDLVPDVELVVVSANGDNELSMSNETFCMANTGNFADASNYYNNLERQLIDLIESHNIDYLSLSSYATAADYQRAWPFCALEKVLALTMHSSLRHCEKTW